MCIVSASRREKWVEYDRIRSNISFNIFTKVQNTLLKNAAGKRRCKSLPCQYSKKKVALEAKSRSVQQLLYAFGGTGNHGPRSADDDWPIHHFGMRYKQTNKCFALIVRVHIQPQLVERARMQHLFGLYIEHLKKFSELGLTRRGLYVFNDVELDAAVAQYGQRTV